MPRDMPTEAQIKRVIKTLDAAWEALGCFTGCGDIPADDTRVRLRSDMREYLEYLERATWWRKV